MLDKSPTGETPNSRVNVVRFLSVAIRGGDFESVGVARGMCEHFGPSAETNDSDFHAIARHGCSGHAAAAGILIASSAQLHRWRGAQAVEPLSLHAGRQGQIHR